MQLKKIELQGFKSFADKTEILFLDGITTIVGPNGSGKSNISDALKWVLGEQSVKTLRGSKMEDVIFAGTEARKKVGFAEVSMYLDNSDASLPVEFKEVVVTRRVYRTGESNYLINGDECRLKDVQELFMDTGVGKDGYSIISQGKIDEILSTKSEERRHIFEEASGIVKYRTRKEEATRKLEHTETTLARVGDILTEIENTLGPLEKKCETAKKYLKFRDELKSLEVHIFIDALEKNTHHLNHLEDMIATLEEDIQIEEKEYQTLEETKQKLKEKLNQVILQIEEAQSKYYEIENENEKLNSKIGIANAGIETSHINLERLALEIQEDTQKIEMLNAEITARLEKRDSMSSNKRKFEEELEEKQSQLNELMETVDSKGREIANCKIEIDEKSEEKYQLRIEIGSMQATIEANEKQLEERMRSSEKNVIQKDSVNAQKEDIYLVLSQKENLLHKKEEEQNSLEKVYQEMRQHLEAIQKEEAAKKQEVMILTSKLTYLKNLQNENEGYMKSVKSALDMAKQRGKTTVYGTLANVISTKENLEYAIEIALGGYIQNIIVEEEQDAKELIGYLQENALGRATFLPLQQLKVNRYEKNSKLLQFPGVLGMANELVTYDKKYQRAIDLALGGTVIVDTIDHALQLSKNNKTNLKIVTLQGELIASTGSMTGGKNNHKSAGLIGRQEKIQELTNMIEDKQRKLSESSENVNQMQQEIQIKLNMLENIKQEKEGISIEVATYKEKYENIQKEVLRLSSHLENNQKTLEEIEIQNKALQEKIRHYQETESTLQQEIDEKQEEIAEYARFHHEQEKRMDDLHEDVVNLKISLSSFDESVASIDEMKEKLEQDIKHFKEGITRKQEQRNALNEEIAQHQQLKLEAEEEMKKQSSFKEGFTKLSEELKQEKEDVLERQEIMDQKLLDSIKKQDKIKEEKGKVESKKEKYVVEMDELKNKMWEDYELTISGAKKLQETLPALEEKNIEKRTEALRKEIKNLGEVNISSIEEYQSQKERYDFIYCQKSDLEETKQKLLNLIHNMTTIMKQQFSKQFEIITKNFNETFQELFGGGKADLKLSDESNILESGIEIEVQPPGKKLQSMMLLSGGERALTATALLFAILKIKSPPFCILDEIEAALDDVNVHRFAEYIKKYSNKTQFIVITHRKGTMEVASSVYGVTMQEYGISKVVSMKLK